MSKIGTRGTTRDGTAVTVSAVYTNAVLVKTANGAQFTVLNDEFTPLHAKREERASIRARCKALFSGIGKGDGFAFCITRSPKSRRITGATLKRVPPFGGDLTDEQRAPAPSIFVCAWETARARAILNRELIPQF